MVKKLQFKLVVILTIILWLLLVVLLFIMNAYNYASIESEYNRNMRNAEQMLRRLYMNNVKEENVEKVIDDLKDYDHIYSVIVDQEGKIQYYIYSSSKYEKISADVQEVWLHHLKMESKFNKKNLGENGEQESVKKYGYVTEKYRYRVKSFRNVISITYVDNSVLYGEMKYMLIISGGVMIVGIFILLLLSIVIVLAITRPVAESYERQKRFVADASHELKTPLAVIGVNLEMLQNSTNQGKYLAYIKQESDKMNQLIQELLLMASVDEEECKLELEQLDLSDIVEGAVQPFEAVAYEQGVTLESQIASDISYHGNADKLQRLVGILLDNAIKHADYEKQVCVMLKREKKHIVLSVTNTGKVISKEDQKKIFERFYRVDKSRSRKDGRFGLGLSIAKAIVEQHHGKIQVHSEHNITSFVVKL